jgi:hypothetical protein
MSIIPLTTAAGEEGGGKRGREEKGKRTLFCRTSNVGGRPRVEQSDTADEALREEDSSEERTLGLSLRSLLRVGDEESHSDDGGDDRHEEGKHALVVLIGDDTDGDGCDDSNGTAGHVLRESVRDGGKEQRMGKKGRTMINASCEVYPIALRRILENAVIAAFGTAQNRGVRAGSQGNRRR